MGKQKYTAKEKKVSRMTRNGLVEENLATKETRKVTNSDQELSYKQKDVEQAFITSEKKKNSHKKVEKKQFSEKVQKGNPAKKEEAACASSSSASIRSFSDRAQADTAALIKRTTSLRLR